MFQYDRNALQVRLRRNGTGTFRAAKTKRPACTCIGPFSGTAASSPVDDDAAELSWFKQASIYSHQLDVLQRQAAHRLAGGGVDRVHNCGRHLAIGVHTGEIAVLDDMVTGRALNIAEQIAALAAACEVLASAIVRDLVPGSGLRFVERDNQVIADGDSRLGLLAVTAERHLEPHRRPSRTPGLEILSDREREVLRLVADGLSNARIAEQLRLSDHTVKRHVANILLKLDLPTRAAAAALIGRNR